MKELNWKKAIIAGIIGTVLFDIVGFIFTGQWWDIPGLLGQKTGLGFVYGIFGHYANGIVLAILYTAMAPHLWGPHWLRPLIFITAETIALVWLFMLPLLGAGVAGINQSPMAPVVTLLRHFAFALPLIFWMSQEFTNPPKQAEATA
ncbi:DUF2938 domain-containing protein [Fodinibius sediminis]|uniref:DUF2938 domain-containing protein n=1 Tax=Fodinibius sediminis TaxID=1214077 RepID=A0A521CKD5_9BACT|nr:DUF2938 domain-containing protein [Fodinibius sediminis]SMO59923.1 hypothetical protein SAMN06265218_106160 [Fodinibius sediminis]